MTLRRRSPSNSSGVLSEICPPHPSIDSFRSDKLAYKKRIQQQAKQFLNQQDNQLVLLLECRFSLFLPCNRLFLARRLGALGC